MSSSDAGDSQMTALHHVVIIGGGFGGLHAARSLKSAPLRVTLVDRRNFHLFQPLLYQVATGGLSPANIAVPLRAILSRNDNTEVLLAEVCDVDLSRRRIKFSDGGIDYDTLIVAAGAGHHYFGNDHWAQFAPGLKSIEDATEIRRRILLAFEAAERETDPDRVREWLTFVIVGGGPTGVELAGALAELARDTLTHQFRSIDPSHAQVILLEGHERILPPYPPALSAKARLQLELLGVTVRTGTQLTNIAEEAVTISAGNAEESIATRTVLWAAGVKCSPLGTLLATAAGVEPDRMGRVAVGPDLTLQGHPEVFVIGDLTNCSQEGTPLPGIAPVAVQQGRYVARLIRRRLRNRISRPFHYRDYGTMATIGRAKAVAVLGRFQLSGYLAWLVWLFVHLLQLVQFENRMLVLLQWAWNYFTWNRAARLITGAAPFPLVDPNPVSRNEAPGR